MECESIGGPSASDGNRTTIALNGSAKFFKRQFGVIAGASRLNDDCFAIGEQPSKENGGFDLSAGERHFVLNGPESGAVDFQRREIFFARTNVGAHLPKGSDDPLHGTLLKRRVT